jgi:hypothetical protein
LLVLEVVGTKTARTNANAILIALTITTFISFGDVL